MMQINEPWVSEPATQQVCAALTASGAQALFVGGCVRNALLGAPVSDIDIATDARPQQVVEMAQAAGLKAIPTGIDHGTITVVSAGIPHEITTFRRDVETDGRRAVVAFSDHVEEDAARRDFTMNAIYAQPDGTVLDPLEGLPDLEARRVRFIGTAENRIREDYLRSLRYFRFHAWYGDPQAGFDPDALSAIGANLDGLKSLSRERVGAELLKLLAAPDPAPAIATMRSTGVLAQLLPGANDRSLAPLVALEQAAGADPDPVRRLAAIATPEDAATLRLSRSQLQRLTRMRNEAQATTSVAELGYRYGDEGGLHETLLRCAFLEQPWSEALRHDLHKGAAARFPIQAKDLIPTFTGPALGQKLAELESRWIASGFALSREELLAS
ncbi:MULTISPECIES: CCA tRNA nucleotidyltransferase [unclassified Ruegeria]|uniref:CCA tRNA nucleotidyltransferase n=1 Tax=unclassified Ruegeria TaxID=2625375 RepID=UPI001491FCF3|nr:MULTISPECIES: CCA tRNA nucleotidyltransferase [unclassified Ruegeria]NOD33329.1 CCA tRNA nucleotidyltransferase [Ruegeria sp. HKCCD7296]NOE41443.1 CCA tRNA nucleotidyltransferase [Ruegeria sp. HKCCD7319]